MLIVPFGETAEYQGARYFWKLAAEAGLDQSAFVVTTTADYERHATNGDIRVIACLGSTAFSALTGITDNTRELRGYLFRMDECRPVERYTTEQYDVYRTTRKAPDGSIIRRRGDPKYRRVRTLGLPPLPPGAEFITCLSPPRSVQRGQFKTLPILIADLQRIARLLAGKAQPVAVEISDTFPTITTELTLDIETIGHSVAIERIGVAGSSGPVTTVPWSAEARRWLTTVVGRPGLTIIGHNLQFDLARLRRAGVRVPRTTALFDTMFAAKLLLPDASMGLGNVASIYTDTFRWKHKSETNPTLYNAHDVAVTRSIAAAQRAIIDNAGMGSLFHDTMMPGLHILLDITERGIPIHTGFIGNVQLSAITALQPVGADHCIHPSYIPDTDLWGADPKEPSTGRLTAMNPQLWELPTTIRGVLVPQKATNLLVHVHYLDPSRPIQSLEPLVTHGFITNHFGRKQHFYGFYRKKDGTITGPDKFAPENFITASNITDAIWSRLGGMEATATALGGQLLAVTRVGFVVEVGPPVPHQPLVTCMEAGTGLRAAAHSGNTFGTLW